MVLYLALLPASAQTSSLHGIHGVAEEFMRVFLAAKLEMFSYSSERRRFSHSSQRKRKESLPFVLGLAEMELISPTAALVVLCSVLVARTVLITHQCFGYC